MMFSTSFLNDPKIAIVLLLAEDRLASSDKQATHHKFAYFMQVLILPSDILVSL